MAAPTDEEPEQYLFTYVLRGGRAPAKLGAIGILKRVLARLRVTFPRAQLRVRLDGGFAGPRCSTSSKPSAWSM